MKQHLFFAALGGCMILSACATNTQTALNEEDEQPIEIKEVVSGRDTVGMDDDEMICRRRQVTGTRIKKTICRTWGEWQMIEEQSEQATTAIQRRRGQCAGEGC